MNTAAVTATRSPARRLAELACQLDTRRNELANIEKLLTDFGQGGITPVEGERTHAARLRTLLQKASTLLEGIADGSTQEDTVDELESLLKLGDWQLGHELVAELATKANEQQRTIANLEGVLREQRAILSRMRQRLEKALRTGALVVAETGEVSVLEDLVKQSERAITERRYLDAQLLIQRLQGADEKRRSPDQVLAAIDAAMSTAQAIAQRDELLLIGQQVGETQWEYTLLLRSGRVNMQDSTTLVVKTRERARKVAEQVAFNVNQRIRATRLRELSAPPASEEMRFVDVPQHLRKVGELLYRLFVPEAMHQVLRHHMGQRPSSLVLTTNDLELPWELLHDGDEFICLTRPMGRMVMGRVQPREKRPAPRNPKLRFLVVYADPNQNIPEAKKEVESIASALRTKWKDRIVVDAWTKPEEVTGDRFNDALLDGRYDVNHYAGHASFNPDHPELSGLLLTDGEVLFAQKLRRLLSGQPLIFLNACESGRVANEQDMPETNYMGKPAEGLASALLDGGAVACIGALWPVYDDAAADFAISFYNLLLQGHVIGEALRQARVESRKQHGQSATWASFALYGDPTVPLAEPSS